MATENAIRKSSELYDKAIDFDELERRLEEDLDSQLLDLDFLIEDRKKINNPESLGDTVMNVIWEQFLNQIAVTAGEDFIQENRGLTLDLRNKAHIQDLNDFEGQQYAEHNVYVDYKKRGEEYRANFYTDPNEKPPARLKQEQRYNEKTMTWETYDEIDGTWIKSLRKGYREPYDQARPKGNKTINKDHQISEGTIVRDPEAGAYMATEEKAAFANSDDNLNDLDSAANQSKSDHDGEKWLKHIRTGSKGKGQTNGEYFGIDEEAYIEKDRKSKEAWKKEKEKKKDENIALGKQSQKEEAFRITGKALQAVIMQFLAELVKTVISKLVAWIKSGQKNLESFISQIKAAITSFVSDMKKHVLNAGDTLVTTIAASIFGPMIRTIKKAFTLIKQGVKSIKEAIDYIKNPQNSNKPAGVLMLEVGKIVIAGASAAGSIIVSEPIEKGLMAIPVFAIEIPLLGSLASILGMFIGGLVFGIIGALAINLIDKAIAKKQLSDNSKMQIAKRNDIIRTQDTAIVLQQEKLYATKKHVSTAISTRNKKAGAFIKGLMTDVTQDDFYEELQANEDPLKEINFFLSQTQEP